MVSFVLSVLLHAALFIQFTNAKTNNNSHAQAPVQNKRITLNLLNPVKQEKKKEEKIEPKKIKSKKAERKIIKKKQNITQKQHEQATAPKINREVKRQQAAKIAFVQQQYLSRLLIHIEGHKFYPYAARARGTEGSIQVSFHLLADGSITGLYAKGDSLRLTRAAKRAVTDALPLPLCPAEVVCPMQVSYIMQFKLR